MLRFALRQLSFRRARALALGAGVLVASVSFALLTAAATTSELRVQGTVEESFRGAYDVLVRPTAAVTDLEEQRGLVASNFLSGTFGGITREQYESVLDTPGVEVPPRWRTSAMSCPTSSSLSRCLLTREPELSCGVCGRPG